MNPRSDPAAEDVASTLREGADSVSRSAAALALVQIERVLEQSLALFFGRPIEVVGQVSQAPFQYDRHWFTLQGALHKQCLVCIESMVEGATREKQIAGFLSFAECLVSTVVPQLEAKPFHIVGDSVSVSPGRERRFAVYAIDTTGSNERASKLLGYLYLAGDADLLVVDRSRQSQASRYRERLARRLRLRRYSLKLDRVLKRSELRTLVSTGVLRLPFLGSARFQDCFEAHTVPVMIQSFSLDSLDIQKDVNLSNKNVIKVTMTNTDAEKKSEIKNAPQPTPHQKPGGASVALPSENSVTPESVDEESINIPLEVSIGEFAVDFNEFLNLRPGAEITLNLNDTFGAKVMIGGVAWAIAEARLEHQKIILTMNKTELEQ